MKKQLAGVLGAIILGLTSGNVSAADADIPSAYDWSGLYAGVQAGYGFGESEHYTTATPASSGEFDIEGFVGGLTMGANMQANDIVFGLEGDISFSDIGGTGDTSGSWGCLEGCDTELYWLGTVRARLGLALGDTLPYVTGGLAVGDAEGKIDSANSAIYNAGKDTLVGWTAGGGIEHAFSSNLSGKIEYLYTDLGHADLIDFGAAGVGKADVKFGTVRIGLNWQF